MTRLLTLLTLLTLWAYPSPSPAQSVVPPGTSALVCAYNSSPPTISPSNFAYVQCDATGKLLTSGAASGNVVGPGSSTTGDLSIFADTTGKLLSDSGVLASSLLTGTKSGNTTVFATASGALTSTHCVNIDASGNFTDSGAACGTTSTGANPSATAGPAAVNGSSPNFMRADGAPAIQLGTSAQKGIIQVDNTTITATAGVISAVNTGNVAGPGSSVNNNLPTFSGTGGKTLQDSGVALSGQASSTLGVLSQQPGYISTLWYPATPLGAPLGSNNPASASSVYCEPFTVAPGGVTIKSLGVNVTTNDAAKFVGIAIYYNGSNGRPAAQIDHVATLTLAGTGALSGAVANTTDVLTAGVYWACATTSSATVAAFIGAQLSSTQYASYIGGATLTGALASQPNLTLSCVAGSTCGGSFAVWSSSTFNWFTLASATWTLNGTISIGVAFQVN